MTKSNELKQIIGEVIDKKICPFCKKKMIYHMDTYLCSACDDIIIEELSLIYQDLKKKPR